MPEGENSLSHIDMLALPAFTLKGPMALPIKVGRIKGLQRHLTSSSRTYG
jgi:hypothetical protein